MEKDALKSNLFRPDLSRPVLARNLVVSMVSIVGSLVFLGILLTGLVVPRAFNKAFSKTAHPSRLPLSVPDTIVNRCHYPSSLTNNIPCRPLMGRVRKRFRAGNMPRARQVTISDKYRFVYLKLPKTAGTTVHYGYFHSVLCPMRPGDKKVKHYFDKAREAPIRANCSDDILFPSLDKGVMPPGISQVRGEKLIHYFVFTIVRNPWARAVSAYEYCTLDMLGSFREFARRPQTFGPSCTLDKVDKNKPTYPNYHWHPLVPELCDPSGTNCLVDYVVDLDNLNPMMDEVISIINDRRDKSLPPLPKFSDVALDLNRNKNQDKYARYYKECPECVDWIREFYEEDITMLGYDYPY